MYEKDKAGSYFQLIQGLKGYPQSLIPQVRRKYRAAWKQENLCPFRRIRSRYKMSR